MILISIKSEIMDCKKQYEKDTDAEKFLKRVKKIHNLSRFMQFRKPEYKRKRLAYCILLKDWKRNLSAAIPLRIEIINTNANQLQLQIK